MYGKSEVKDEDNKADKETKKRSKSKKDQNDYVKSV